MRPHKEPVGRRASINTDEAATPAKVAHKMPNKTPPTRKEVVEAEARICVALMGKKAAQRNGQVRKLPKWFEMRATSSNPITEDELMRICSALYWNLYRADEQELREELTEQLAQMVDSFGGNTTCSLAYFSAFMRILCERFVIIEPDRVDVFFELISRMLWHMLRLITQSQWSAKLINAFNYRMQKSVLTDQPKSHSIVVHYMSIFFKELAVAADGAITAAEVNMFLSPFVTYVAMQRDDLLVDQCEVKVLYYLLFQTNLGRNYTKRYQKVGSALDPLVDSVDLHLPVLPFNADCVLDELQTLMRTNAFTSQRRNALRELVHIFEIYKEGAFPLRHPKLIEMLEEEVEDTDDSEDLDIITRTFITRDKKKVKRRFFNYLKESDDDSVDSDFTPGIGRDRKKVKRSFSLYIQESDEDSDDSEDSDFTPRKRRKLVMAKVKQMLTNNSEELDEREDEAVSSELQMNSEPDEEVHSGINFVLVNDEGAKDDSDSNTSAATGRAEPEPQAQIAELSDEDVPETTDEQSDPNISAEIMPEPQVQTAGLQDETPETTDESDSLELKKGFKHYAKAVANLDNVCVVEMSDELESEQPIVNNGEQVKPKQKEEPNKQTEATPKITQQSVNRLLDLGSLKIIVPSQKEQLLTKKDLKKEKKLLKKQQRKEKKLQRMAQQLEKKQLKKKMWLEKKQLQRKELQENKQLQRKKQPQKKKQLQRKNTKNSPGMRPWFATPMSVGSAY